jgi:hypothetical protein
MKGALFDMAPSRGSESQTVRRRAGQSESLVGWYLRDATEGAKLGIEDLMSS